MLQRAVLHLRERMNDASVVSLLVPCQFEGEAGSGYMAMINKVRSTASVPLGLLQMANGQVLREASLPRCGKEVTRLEQRVRAWSKKLS